MIVVYSESKGRWLGKFDWVTCIENAESFKTADEARTAVERQRPEGQTESIALLNFLNREVVGLKQLFSVAARRHYAKKVTEEA